MNIAVILPSLGPFGPVTVARDTIDYLVAQGHRVDVYYFDEKADPLTFACSTRRIKFFDSLAWDHYDIIHSHQLRPDLFVWMHRRSIRIPKISTIHQDIWNDFSRNMPKYKAYVFTWLWKRILRSFDCGVFVSRTIQNDNAIAVRSECIHNGRSPSAMTATIADTDRELLARWRAQGLHIAGCIGSLIPRKRMDAVIGLMSNHPDWALMILGEGPKREELQRQIEHLGLSDRICLCGFRAPAYPYLSQWDLFVLASESEGLCLSLIEAMSMKTPCLCTQTPANEELFGSIPVQYFSADFLVTLRDSINTKFTHNQKLVPYLFERYQEEFSKDRMGKRYLDLYARLLDHH